MDIQDVISCYDRKIEQLEEENEKKEQENKQLQEEIKNKEEADFIIFNTCAVREGAQERVYGNLGALKHRKSKEDDLIIGICGCMAQQTEVAKKIKSKFRHVDMVFGTHSLHRFPEIGYDLPKTLEINSCFEFSRGCFFIDVISFTQKDLLKIIK